MRYAILTVGNELMNPFFFLSFVLLKNIIQKVLVYLKEKYDESNIQIYLSMSIYQLIRESV